MSDFGNFNLERALNKYISNMKFDNDHTTSELFFFAMIWVIATVWSDQTPDATAFGVCLLWSFFLVRKLLYFIGKSAFEYKKLKETKKANSDVLKEVVDVLKDVAVENANKPLKDIVKENSKPEADVYDIKAEKKSNSV